MKVLHVDDHKMFREAMASFILSQRPDWEIQTCGSFYEARKSILENHYDLLLADLHIPNEEFSSFYNSIKKETAGIPILILSMEDDFKKIQEILKLGIRGYVTKESDSKQILLSMELVVAGKYSFDQLVLSEMVAALALKVPGISHRNRVLLTPLSSREQDVFILLTTEKSLDDIAAELYISRKTVENHRSSIYSKIGVHDRHELYQYARRNNIVTSRPQNLYLK